MKHKNVQKSLVINWKNSGTSYGGNTTIFPENSSRKTLLCRHRVANTLINTLVITLLAQSGVAVMSNHSEPHGNSHTRPQVIALWDESLKPMTTWLSARYPYVITLVLIIISSIITFSITPENKRGELFDAHVFMNITTRLVVIFIVMFFIERKETQNRKKLERPLRVNSYRDAKSVYHYAEATWCRLLCKAQNVANGDDRELNLQDDIFSHKCRVIIHNNLKSLSIEDTQKDVALSNDAIKSYLDRNLSTYDPEIYSVIQQLRDDIFLRELPYVLDEMDGFNDALFSEETINKFFICIKKLREKLRDREDEHPDFHITWITHSFEKFVKRSIKLSDSI